MSLLLNMLSAAAAAAKSLQSCPTVQPHRWQPTRLRHPWDSPGKNTGVGCHFLLQGIFPTQGSNPGLPHHRQLLYRLSQNAGLEEAHTGIKIAGRNINNLRYADDTTLMAESEQELKSLLMKLKEESEKVGLELNIQKMKILASGPITSWEIDGETVETVSDFIFWASKSLQMVTAAMKLKDAYSLEGKLLPA